MVVAAVGFGVVGFLDDYAKVKRQRSLGLTKAQKFAGTAIVSLVFAWLVMHYGHDAGISTHVSFVRPTAIALGALFVVWAFFVLTGSSNAVNLTDGLDGLAAGSVDPGIGRVHLHQLLAVPAHVRPARGRGRLLRGPRRRTCRTPRSSPPP